MNQQRSRRFRASKESAEKVIEVEKIRAKLENEGAILPPPKEGSHFDSNCITPVRNQNISIYLNPKMKALLSDTFRALLSWIDYRNVYIITLTID